MIFWMALINVATFLSGMFTGMRYERNEQRRRLRQLNRRRDDVH